MELNIADGKLRNGQGFDVRYLTENDMQGILELQEKVLRNLDDPDRLQPLRKDEYENILKDGRLMIGIFAKEQLIAYRAFMRPIGDEEGLGADAGLSEEEKGKIIYSEISAVDPEYRGNGLQKYMGKVMMESLDMGNTKYVLATVAPFNIPSLKDKFALDMEIINLKEKFNGKLRYVFMKDLAPSQDKLYKKEEIIHMGDIEGQQKLLIGGYTGNSMTVIDGEWHVHYRR